MTDAVRDRDRHVRVVYSPKYNIRFLGLERLHPFDSCKYGRAWKLLRKQFGSELSAIHLKPDRPVNTDDLQRVHTREYLEELKSASYLARALEVPQLKKIPASLIDFAVLRPMRWAAAGTIQAARAAIDCGGAINLSGGYHHADRNLGHGFCIYSDIALAVASLRQDNKIGPASRVVYIDLDAHQGDGVARIFANDRSVMIFDMYNTQIFPGDDEARRRIDCEVPLAHGCGDIQYLNALTSELPRFLDSVTRTVPASLAIYNAGTDIVQGDPLGGMSVSPDAVLQRDRFVIDQLRQRGIPWLLLPSGGYARDSFKLLAAAVAYAIGSA